MGYVAKQTLYGKDENVVYVSKKHWITLIGPTICAYVVYKLNFLMGMLELIALIYVIMAGGAVIWLVRTVLYLFKVEIGVTNKRIISNDNYFSSMNNGNYKLPGLRLLPDMDGFEEGIKLVKVHGIGIRQDFLGRIFNYGTIIVRTIDGESSPFRYFKKPLEFQAKVQNQIMRQIKEHLPELVNFMKKLESEEPDLFT